ncbi:putative methyltransferase DDB_G0268948 [Lissotriton helveticus]
MAFRFFETKERASIYQKHMIPAPKKVHDVILSYLEEKKGRPFELAVDVGCGSGQATNVLAAHFQKVLGIDISEAQIEEAKRVGSPSNVSYLVAAAEKMPFEDNSVDLITSSTAAHWFNMKAFMTEVDRLLKPNGCLAIYNFRAHVELYYKDYSQSASDALNEALEFIATQHGPGKFDQWLSEYKEIFDEVHFADKKRVTRILQKLTMSVEALMRLMESTCMYQNFLLKEPEAAKEFVQNLQERLLKILGVSSTNTELEMVTDYFCVLARKPA